MEHDQTPYQVMIEKSTPMWDATVITNFSIMQENYRTKI